MKLSFRLPLLACASAAALLAAPAANAHETGVPHRQAKAAAGEDSTSVPLFENLGSHSYPVTTANPLAQAYLGGCGTDHRHIEQICIHCPEAG
ncbi:hypothetical protein [Mesorhizobium sp.]|uniref:hypothetical protein n=1 Tax=Mesorhizobium sp. TaxID=1871066 RepID=UPI0011F8E7A0|nr:hypothetical protein [Mesorhizobium sp.]TIL35613.1 MAG: hypothetical protein E5Y85_06130 [Mesorhizobium sp.]TIL36620.1 MAG: hypothetical protein E5Y85_03215 [Mesorhizobium sp.]